MAIDKKLMRYGGDILPRVKSHPAYAKYIEETDSNEPSDLGIEEIDSEEDLMEDLPSLDDQPKLDSGSEDLAKAKEGADRLAKMLEQNVRDTAEYEKLKKQIESGEGGLEPLETNEKDDQAELEAQEMKNIEARSKQMEEDWKKAGQEKESIEADTEGTKVPKRAPSYEEQVISLTKEKQKKEDMYDLWQAAGRLGGGKQDTTIFDQMRKKANRPLENLMLEKQLEQQKLERQAKNIKLAQEAKDARAASDPNSDISKFTREFLIQYGGMETLRAFPNISYNQLKERYPTLIQALYTQVSAKANIEREKIKSVVKKLEILANEKKSQDLLDFKNKELSQAKELKNAELNLDKLKVDTQIEANAEARIQKAKDNEDDRKFKLANEARFRVKDLYDKDSPYTKYQKATDAASNLDSLIMRFRKGEAPDKIAEGAAFFEYAKIAQGDNSVLKDADIRLLAGGMEVDKFLEILARKLQGAKFTETDLRNMKKVMEVTRRINKEKTYRLKIKPMLKWAKQNDYDLSENLDPDVVNQISSDFIKAEQESEARQQKIKKLEEMKKTREIKK